MSKWIFEPAHTGAEFCVRHMMITDICGHLPNIRGTLDFDFDNPQKIIVDVIMDATEIWTGDKDRDRHLKSAAFFDVKNYPSFIFQANEIERIGANEFKLFGHLTIRGITRKIILTLISSGIWRTPQIKDEPDKGPTIRAGFKATTVINRHDYGVSWNEMLDRGGMVVGNEVRITINAEVIKQE